MKMNKLTVPITKVAIGTVCCLSMLGASYYFGEADQIKEEVPESVYQILGNEMETDYETEDYLLPEGFEHIEFQESAPHLIITEELFVLDLLKDVEGVSFYGSDNRLVKCYSGDSMFEEVLAIFEECYLSPINYETYPNGGGHYFSENVFSPDINFIKGSPDSDIPGTLCAYFVFHLHDFSNITLEIFENYNLCLESYIYDGEDVGQNYKLPYCLQGDSREVFHKLIDFLESSEL